MPVHEVKQGEHLYRIARLYGFTQLDAIWDHPGNAQLRQERDNPHVLYPGDLLFIPEKTEKSEPCATDRKHRFHIQGGPLRLKLMLTDESDEPLADTRYQLRVHGEAGEGTTDGAGRLERVIVAQAEEAVLDIHELRIPIRIGHLDPVDRFSGQSARLNNLGYDAGPVVEVDEERFRSAVEEFQCDQGVEPVTGVCDAATQRKLREVHGC